MARRGRSRHARRQRQKRPSAPIVTVGLFTRLFRLFGILFLGAAVVGGVALTVYMTDLNKTITQQFQGKRWALPARVYARPLQLFPGAEISADQLAQEMELLPYRVSQRLNQPGTFFRRGDSAFDLYTRSFAFWDGEEPSRQVRLKFADGTLSGIESLDGHEAPALMRLEPAEIAGIYPTHGEDRVLVRYQDLPAVLVDTLIAVEDRAFYNHFGIDPKGILRAALANLRAGRIEQGASTLTQQLVKNFFLTNERTVERKVNEVLMALLVEWHYSKEEILEAYSNEIYLGQDGSRSIHGFGLASRFYFDRTLNELDLHHIALLVGIIKGPSKYDPRRKPELALERRGIVLDIMVEQNLISAEDAAIAKAMPLDVTPGVPRGRGHYPAFLDLVRRQLRENYRDEDLTSEGLKVFTTLDPRIQALTEEALLKTLPKLDKKAKLKAGALQVASVVADTQTGEVRAIVGGRDSRLDGFNRALDAKRPAGSLLKPAVFLTALEFPQEYTLSTLLNDNKLIYRPAQGKAWEPKNYDKRYHGNVMLQDALARSYNIATARLGLELDVMRVVQTLQRLGLQQELKPYPSLLLGSVDLSPLEVSQLYATFASGGYRIPLRAITEVTAASGQPLPRLYSLSLEKAIQPGPAFLITKAMQKVVQDGTAKLIAKELPDFGIAGKTGTTDDWRDSWFAGFSGNLLTVVWLGRDDNKPHNLSGSTGALPLWLAIMKSLPLVPLDLTEPVGVSYALVDPKNGLRANKSCSGAIKVPFINGSEPAQWSNCAYRESYTQDSVTGDDPEAMGSFFRRLLR
ncbi:MAG: penicillin-binding protein 1B [Candidatus Competibacteraceae bacterium]|nr:penicillin-binding protein 1B [Candidatus Competibacteraceae bacterium]